MFRSERVTALLRLCAALLVVWLPSGCGGSGAKGPQATWEGDRATVVLEYKGDAREISAVGDFNAWNPDSHPFIESEDGLWRCSLSLPTGNHTYLLAVETESQRTWQLDVANPERTTDGLGRELSLLVIGSGAGDDTGAP